ncbi:MAG: alpha/beta hydrolase [Myxococcaceae bacterium]
MKRIFFLFFLLLACAGHQANTPISAVGASFLEHPLRTPEVRNPGPHQEISFKTAEGFTLKGWLFRTAVTPARGWVVYLHGKDANRSNGAHAARALLKLGFNVLAYDHRAHGESEGTTCTYGVREAQDLHIALETFTDGPVFLVGESLGAATALEAAPNEPRVVGVVAAAPFSDMKTIVREIGAFASDADLNRVLAQFQQDTGLNPEDISPAQSAKNIHVPVLFLRGTEDKFMAIEHIERIRQNLPGESQFIRLEGVTHADVLAHDQIWEVVAKWIDAHSAPR